MSYLKLIDENSVLNSDINNIYKGAKDSLDRLSGKKVLLTGGAGFLGYELLYTLLNIGVDDGRAPAKITVIENFKRGKKTWFDELVKAGKFELIESDISIDLPIEGKFYDYIIHAASIASPIIYRQFPIETIDANINGVRFLLDYSRKCAELGRPISGMLFFSTSEIYGDPSPDAIPTREDYRGFVSCTGPRACYDESKRLGETLCVNFAQKYSLPVTIARPFNNYGPGLGIRDKRLLPDLASNIIKNESITLFSDGSATRTFCYVSDAVIGYLKVLTHGKSGEAYNIGTEFPEITVREFSEMVLKVSSDLFNYKGKIIFSKSDDNQYLTDNPKRRCPDITKAKTYLGFNPSISLEEGLYRSMVWYRGESGI